MIQFYKYHGAGNDFVMIDNRDGKFDKNDIELVKSMCDRRFGIGADGLILIESSTAHAFEMVYYNSDGSNTMMCGNGGRCIVAFAKELGLVKEGVAFVFKAIDGPHDAIIEDGLVKLGMIDVNEVSINQEGHAFLDTGTLHYVQLVDDVDNYNVVTNGRAIRNSEPHKKEGTNVNFVQKIGDDTFKVRTYERGVEDETLACGTGVTAVAIVMHKMGQTNSNVVKLKAVGGDLEVSFDENNGNYTHVFLKGSAAFVFEGFF